MWCNVYDDEGKVVSDSVEREKLLLEEEAKRIRTFLEDVSTMMEMGVTDIGEFPTVVRWLEYVRECNDDRASTARSFLNRAAAIDADIFRHRKYVEYQEMPIVINDILS